MKKLTMTSVVHSHLASSLWPVDVDLVLGFAIESSNCHDSVVLPLAGCLVMRLQTPSSHLQQIKTRLLDLNY